MKKKASNQDVNSSKPGKLSKLCLSVLAATCVGLSVSNTAQAYCIPAFPQNGDVVTCLPPTNPLAPSFFSAANDLTVNVESGASLGVLLGLGGTALALPGNNITLNNNGVIDPSLLGILTILSTGASIGNTNPSTVNVTNNGIMRGTSGLIGVNLANLTGMALAVQNGIGGVTNFVNNGFINSVPLLGVVLFPADIPVLAATGGGVVHGINTGTIVGRMAFESSGTPGVGHTFVNSGNILGGLSMGVNSVNTFTAVTGSTVAGIGLGVYLPVLGLNLLFAPTGVIDGGFGGNNTLILQNAVNGTGSGTAGVGSAPSGTYINFQHLVVNSGTWNVSGPGSYLDAVLNGGNAVIDTNTSLGIGSITGNGGIIQPAVNGLNVPNPILLAAGGLTALVTQPLLTLSGGITGTGALTKAGAGVLLLTGAATHTGGTNIAEGTLAIGAGGSLPATGLVNLTQPGAILDISAAIGAQVLGNLNGVGGSQVVLGANDLIIAGIGAGIFDGSIGGTGGLIKNGPGSLVLNGINPLTGTTTVNDGLLQLNGSVGGDLLVNAGGRLEGVGTIGGNAIINGTIAPGLGLSIGTLDVLGNLIQNPGSIFEVQVNPLGQSDLIQVAGSAILNGGLVNVMSVNGLPFVMGTYGILTATGGVTGTFAGALPLMPFLNFNLLYGPNSVSLQIARSALPISGVATSPNQSAVGNGLESLPDSSLLKMLILNLPTVESAQQALNSLSGEALASVTSSLITAGQFVENTMLNRLTSPMDYQKDPNRPYGAINFWAQGVGNWGHRDGNYNYARVRVNSGGIFIGADANTDATRFGVFGGYSELKNKVNQRSSTVDVDTYYLGLYGSARMDHWIVRAGGAYGWNDFDSVRHVVFPRVDEYLRADYNGNTAQAFLEAAYALDNSWQLEPFARLSDIDVATDSIHERGGITALNGWAHHQNIAFTTLGARVTPLFVQRDTYNITGHGLLGWNHAYDNLNPYATFAFPEGGGFTVSGNPIARNALAINAGVDVLVPAKSVTLTLNYMGQLADRVQQNGVMGVASWRFN
ncbi:Extracellular serine protease precursor [Legionella birminghamensis]|uniref:Extracellular serine protease n=1 Tax=Legionella birminghamensis TaxID=28083 RepID=A0A378IA17_9GAMM|nr:autotransporter domain-containing protein [Legionella birminghamensis]KTC75941.1 Extracellular serine protease precursor [Legionella birminghamensis]STX32067.1 Extracellular serine protease precursor [Legionella birminghamensis]